MGDISFLRIILNHTLETSISHIQFPFQNRIFSSFYNMRTFSGVEKVQLSGLHF
jgi:hypothetical protein